MKRLWYRFWMLAAIHAQVLFGDDLKSAQFRRDMAYWYTRRVPESWDRPGHDRLWHWFGLSRASFITLPRVLVHEMPDDWQMQMARLLEQYDATWDENIPVTAVVNAVDVDNPKKKLDWPSWILDYRHPQKEMIERARIR